MNTIAPRGGGRWSGRWRLGPWCAGVCATLLLTIGVVFGVDAQSEAVYADVPEDHIVGFVIVVIAVDLLEVVEA